MRRTIASARRIVGRSAFRYLAVTAVFAATTLLVSGVFAEAQKAESPAAVGGGAMARVLPPAEKIKVLEEELAKEVDRRVKAEDDNARRITENNELSTVAKSAAKERAVLDVRLAETREREVRLQKVNDRLREEVEHVAGTVRYALPVIAVVVIMVLAMLGWIFRFLRKVAARVHSQRTLAEMHELEGRLAHVNDQFNAELKRNQALRNKLAELGISD